MDYTLRGLHVRLDARWDYEAPPGGGDTHFAVVRGSRARIEVRQGAAQKWRTELYVVPVSPADQPALLAAVRKRVASLAGRYPGLAVAEAGDAVQVLVPDALRTGHEAHFAEVTSRFLEYLKAPGIGAGLGEGQHAREVRGHHPRHGAQPEGRPALTRDPAR